MHIRAKSDADNESIKLHSYSAHLNVETAYEAELRASIALCKGISNLLGFLIEAELSN